MTIYSYNSGPCGSGKTYLTCDLMVQTPGLYIMALDRREVMPEREAMIRSLASAAGTNPRFVSIFSALAPEVQPDGTLQRVGSLNVRTDIEALAGTYVCGHVIVLVTHEGLKSADLSRLGGWHLIIDETPSIFDKQALTSTVTQQFFAQAYELHPLTGATNAIRPRRLGRQPLATAKAFSRDDMAKVVGVLHTRVLNPRIEVATTLPTWDDLADNPTWSWFSIWSPEQLQHFDSVMVLANAFERSVTYRIFKARWPEIEWRSVGHRTERRHATRKVQIHYFANNAGTRAHFNSEVGKRHLRSIALYVDRHVVPTSHIWSCNSHERDLLVPLMPGIGLSPKQAGSNRYAAIDAATMIYTAKPDLADRAVFREMGIEPEVITETREYETILQFVCRTSIRDVASGRTVDIYVYDRDQAAYLQRYCDSTGYLAAKMILVDLGFADYQRDTKCGPKRKVASIEELAEKARQAREGARVRQARRRARAKEPA